MYRKLVITMVSFRTLVTNASFKFNGMTPCFLCAPFLCGKYYHGITGITKIHREYKMTSQRHKHTTTARINAIPLENVILPVCQEDNATAQNPCIFLLA